MRRSHKAATLAVFVVLLVIAGMMPACGGGDETTNLVVLGWLGDQTGPSAGSYREIIMGMDDFVAEMEATNPIEGIKVKIINYDTRLEYSRFPVGYEWLLSQGTDLLLGYSPSTPAVTQANQATDRIPLYGFTAYPGTLQAEWVYAYMPTNALEGQAIMDYLINVWWPAKNMGRPLKVASVGNTGIDTTVQYRDGFSAALAQNPGEAVYTTVGGPPTQTAWADEVSVVRECDAIILSTVGTSSATFLKEAIARGCTSQIVSCSNAVLGSWLLITDMVPKSALDGLIIPHFYPLWNDGTPYSDRLGEMLAKYRSSDAATLKQGTTWLSGWMTAQIVTEAVREAAAKVGADRVDGDAINDAFHTMDVEFEGMPAITLANSGTSHVFQPTFRIIRYAAAQDEWSAVTDWAMVPGLAG